MIGSKLVITSVSYDQFCQKLRRLVPGVSSSRLYREWCLELNRTGNINYEKIAKRLAPAAVTGSTVPSEE